MGEEKVPSRSDLVRSCVLDTIADDYEEIGHITEIVAKLGLECKLTI